MRRAFVDILYEDTASAYRREERVEISGDATEPVARIALLDGAKRSFRHRITLVAADGRMTQAAPVDGEETLIGIGSA